MARIRGRDTRPEKLVRTALWRLGFRFRTHYRTPFGSADLAFTRQNLAVFVDGCQWHGCPEHYVAPRTNRRFWAKKLRANVKRDQAQTIELESMGWLVLRFWEHQVFENLNTVITAVTQSLAAGRIHRGVCWRTIAVSRIDRSGTLEHRVLVDLRDSTPRISRVQRRSTRKWRKAATKESA